LNPRRKDHQIFAPDALTTAPRGQLPFIIWNITDAFIPSVCEIATCKTYLKTLIARKLLCYIDGFKWMKKLTPEHIPHEHQEEMSEKSSIFTLPIMLKILGLYRNNG
jgi:hypothetical protein